MQRSEAPYRGTQAVESVRALKRRVVREHDGLALLQFAGGDRAGSGELQLGSGLVEAREPVHHPETLLRDRLDGPPVHRGGGRAEHLVDAIAIPDLHDEREPIWKLEAHLGPGTTVGDDV